MLIVVTGAEVYRRRFKIRRNNGDVAEGAYRLTETKGADKFGKLRVVAVVEHRVVVPSAVHLYNVIHIDLDSAPFKRPGSLSAGLLILAEQHMAAYFADDLQDHIYAAPVVAADPLRGHDIAPVFGSADDMRQLIMYGVQMGDQQHRHCALGIEEAFLFDCLIAKFLQVTGQIMLQFLLPHTENIIKSNHLAPPSAAVTEVLWQNALPMMRQMLQTLQAAHGSSDAR